MAGSVPEHKLRANIVRTLASRLQQCSVTFRRAQKEFLARRAEQKKSASGGGGSTSFDFLDEKPKGNDLIKVDSPGGAGGFTLEQIEVVENMEDEIATRDHEINTLVSSIEELSQIFKELAVLNLDMDVFRSTVVPCSAGSGTSLLPGLIFLLPHRMVFK